MKIRDTFESKFSVSRNNAAVVRFCNILVWILGLVLIVACVPCASMYNLTAMHVSQTNATFHKYCSDYIKCSEFLFKKNPTLNQQPLKHPQVILYQKVQVFAISGLIHSGLPSFKHYCCISLEVLQIQTFCGFRNGQASKLYSKIK